MESLSDTQWDVAISGTGLAQSLLALALSQSGKKVLHVDKNPYYGGPEAAFSLQEAEEWVKQLKNEPGHQPFEGASIYLPPKSSEGQQKLSFSRAYTLSLSPYLIYARSKLLPSLVSSKVYRQLEFQAVGSWWVYRASTAEGDTSQLNENVSANLHRVPSSREDIFADNSISIKAKRTLVKFIRNISQPQENDDDSPVTEEDTDLPFPEYLTTRFQVPTELHDPLLSLSLSQSTPDQTPASFAVRRVKRHLSSIGVFGPGFGSLLTKWGGGSEIAQVGCRALAVGGGVYVLHRDIQSAEVQNGDGQAESLLHLKLSDGESIRSKFVVGCQWDLPAEVNGPQHAYSRVARSIAIVSSSLGKLFPATAEGGPIPAGAVVVFPGRELGENNETPVYLLVHSSDTGECPDGQCVVYGSVSIAGRNGQSLLDAAIYRLLRNFAGAGNEPAVLWALRYTQLGLSCEASSSDSNIYNSPSSDQIIYFPPPSLDLAFDDQVIDRVKAVWKTVMGAEGRDEDFMTFEDRETNFDE